MRALCLAALFGLLAAAAEAAVVHLKDGGRVEGVIVSATARSVSIHTADGVREIDADRIARIDYAYEPPPPVPAPAPAPAAPPPARHRTLEESLGPDEGDNRLSFELGFGAPLSDVDFSAIGGGRGSNGDVGGLLGMQWLRRLGSRLEAGVDVGYLPRSGTSSLRLLTNAEASTYGDSLLLMAVVRRTLTSRGSARPFLLVGAGGYRNTLTVDAAPLIGFSWSDTDTVEARRLVDDEVWGPAAMARVGVEFRVFEPTLFSVEAGWVGMARSHYEASPQGRALGLDGVSEPLHAFTLAARWGWRF